MIEAIKVNYKGANLYSQMDELGIGTPCLTKDATEAL